MKKELKSFNKNQKDINLVKILNLWKVVKNLKINLLYLNNNQKAKNEIVLFKRGNQQKREIKLDSNQNKQKKIQNKLVQSFNLMKNATNKMNIYKSN